MNKRILVSESEKERILNMHESFKQGKLINEQSEEREHTRAVQKFLNDKRVLNAGLETDGKTGPGSKTEAAIIKLQEKIGVYPTDGVWESETEEALEKNRPDWYKIWKEYKPGIFW